MHAHRAAWVLRTRTLKTYLDILSRREILAFCAVFSSMYMTSFNQGKRHIDFVHKKGHIDGVGGGGLAPVTFLGEKSRKISIV